MQAGQQSKEEIYKDLKEQILTLKAVPHEKLSENAIARQMHVSRTIVRGVFSRLTDEGMITVLPQSGTFVNFISMKKVRQSIYAYNTILAKLLEEICSRPLTQEENKRLREAEVQMQGLSRDTEERMRRDSLLLELLAGLCHREYVIDFLNGMNFDLLRVMRLSYDTFAINSFMYSSTAVESMNVINRMLFDYIRKRDVVAAQMLVQNHYNSVMFQTERLREMYHEYFSG
jgi:DNA-binding GntR family transcriptional regulator